MPAEPLYRVSVLLGAVLLAGGLLVAALDGTAAAQLEDKELNQEQLQQLLDEADSMEELESLLDDADGIVEGDVDELLGQLEDLQGAPEPPEEGPTEPQPTPEPAPEREAATPRPTPTPESEREIPQPTRIDTGGGATAASVGALPFLLAGGSVTATGAGLFLARRFAGRGD